MRSSADHMKSCISSAASVVLLRLSAVFHRLAQRRPVVETVFAGDDVLGVVEGEFSGEDFVGGRLRKPGQVLLQQRTDLGVAGLEGLVQVLGLFF